MEIIYQDDPWCPCQVYRSTHRISDTSIHSFQESYAFGLAAICFYYMNAFCAMCEHFCLEIV